jgi:hypothetical protein
MIAETQFTVEDFKKRIQAMTDEKLVQMGKAARYMADPRNYADNDTVREGYVVQLQECRAEWLRRHPKNTQQTTAPSPNERSVATSRIGCNPDQK